MSISKLIDKLEQVILQRKKKITEKKRHNFQLLGNLALSAFQFNEHKLIVYIVVKLFETL